MNFPPSGELCTLDRVDFDSAAVATAAFTSRLRKSGPVAFAALQPPRPTGTPPANPGASRRADRVDPLAEIVSLLQPGASSPKVVDGAGAWRVRSTDVDRPFYCLILEGAIRLAVDGRAPIMLLKGDFVLVPAARSFTMASIQPAAAEYMQSVPVALLDDDFRLGTRSGANDVRLAVGHCVFGSPDDALLLSILPQAVHVRSQQRLATLVQLVADESRERRPARDVILSRLLEVLLIEALRSAPGTDASPGLLRGLADRRLAVALRQMHEDPTRPWTLAEFADAAALSRSAFVERFSRAVGAAPMAYLLAWRMALARKLLRGQEASVAEVAQRVGYSSASAFSVAFTRHVGVRPARYGRAQRGGFGDPGRSRAELGAVTPGIQPGYDTVTDVIPVCPG